MKINAFLAQRSMTQYRLAKLAGLPHAAISDICSGKAKFENCSAETLYLSVHCQTGAVRRLQPGLKQIKYT